MRVRSHRADLAIFMIGSTRCPFAQIKNATEIITLSKRRQIPDIGSQQTCLANI